MVILKMDNLNYYHMCLNEDEDITKNFPDKSWKGSRSS